MRPRVRALTARDRYASVVTLVPSACRLLRSENPSSSLPKTSSREIVAYELLNARSWRLTAFRGCPNVHVRNDSTFPSPAAVGFRMAASSR